MAFDPITAGLELGGKLANALTKWIPDTAQRDQAAAEIALQVNNHVAGQIDLAKADAQSRSKFVAYWRPTVGWICAASLGYATIGYSFLNWVIAFVGIHAGFVPPMLPPPDITITLELLFGMLGLGGMRTFEKYKGLTK